MDIARPDLARKRKIRYLALAAGALAAFSLLGIGLASLGPATPKILSSSVWIGTVKHGEMLRSIEAPGILIPKESRWLSAQTDARVDRIVVRPGAPVSEDTVIVEMSNPDLLQETAAALYEFRAAEAALSEAQYRLQNEQLRQRAALASARAEYESARLQKEAEEPLAKQGIVAALAFRRSELSAYQLKDSMDIVAERLERFTQSMPARLELKRAPVDQKREAYTRRLEQVESLKVRAGIAGTLQEILVQEGQHVPAGGDIARVARSDVLQAELQVPQSQAHELRIGQSVKVDTRNGIVDSQVVRVDPGVQDGVVKVYADLIGELPSAVRPDLSVDGTIEVEKLSRVLYMGRPTFVQPQARNMLFKISDDGLRARKVTVKLGRVSADLVEIENGLQPGDRVILSDTSAWAASESVRLIK